MKDKSVLLLGSYGQTNLGDDLLMWNYLALLRGRGFEKIYVNASVPGNVPEVIRREFPELVIVPTYKTSVFDWIKIIRSVSCIVYGGGTIFKELYTSTGRGRYSVIVRILFFNIMARLLGARIYYLHIGIGVLKTWLGQFITQGALKSATMTVFRDKQSYDTARNLGITKSRLILANDGLFMNERWQKVWQPTNLALPEGKYKRVVGVNVLADIPDWIDREAYVMAMRAFVKELLDSSYYVLLVPFQHKFNPNNDYKFMQEEIMQHFSEYQNLSLIKNVPIERAVSVFKQIDIFVGMRFHSLLLATSTATPFLAIAYDTKCWRFVSENQYPYAIRLEDISVKTLLSEFGQLVKDAAKVPTVLQLITEKQRKRGRQCIDKLHF